MHHCAFGQNIRNIFFHKTEMESKMCQLLVLFIFSWPGNNKSNVYNDWSASCWPHTSFLSQCPDVVSIMSSLSVLDNCLAAPSITHTGQSRCSGHSKLTSLLLKDGTSSTGQLPCPEGNLRETLGLVSYSECQEGNLRGSFCLFTNQRFQK